VRPYFFFAGLALIFGAGVALAAATFVGAFVRRRGAFVNGDATNSGAGRRFFFVDLRAVVFAVFTAAGLAAADFAAGLAAALAFTLVVMTWLLLLLAAEEKRSNFSRARI
jgi:hypothetical protein